MIEFRLLFALSTESRPPFDVFESIRPPIEHVILFAVPFTPGVMEEECFGDDGTLAIIWRL